MEYDALNRLTKRTYPDSTYEQYTYQRLDLATTRDRTGRITRHFYDGLGRRTSTRDPLGRVVSQVWCTCGALDALIDANGNRTTWERDAQNRVTREVRADGTTDTLYTYDVTGRLKTVTDPKNQVTTHAYGTDDSLTSTTYTNAVIATPGVTYTYETVYPRVASMVDGIGTTTYAYKAPGTLGAGQVASIDGPLTNDTIAYTYDELGRVTGRTIHGSANPVTWAFDALGRVTSEVNLLGTFTYGYDGVTTRLSTVSYPNGQTSTYSYLPTNEDHRLETIHHKYPGGATLSKFDYTYDAVGNILTWRQQADTSAVLWTYGYDAADQLTAAVKESTATPATTLSRYAYGYDPAGNRRFEQIDDQVVAASHDNLNRLLTHTPGGPLQFVGSVNEPAAVKIDGLPATVDASNGFRGTGVTASGTTTVTVTATDPANNTATQQYEVDITGTAKTFTYDANGNMTGDGTRTFEWDAINRVSSVAVGLTSIEFTYDALGRLHGERITVDGVLERHTNFVYCGASVCEERTAGSGAVTARRYSDAFAREGVALFQFRDSLGSIVAVTNNAAGLVGRYAYDPWGRREMVEGTDVESFGYAGQRWLLEAELSLTAARPYKPVIGRFVSEDPMRWLVDDNFYKYAWNAPAVWVDPSGLEAEQSCDRPPCRGYDRQTYESCFWLEMTQGGVVSAAGCAAAGALGGVVVSAICGAGIVISIKVKCAECATTCPGGPNRVDCRVQYVDEEFEMYRLPPPDNRPPPRRYRR